jgi:hypothetical protein
VQRGKIIAAVVLPGLQGKGLCGKEAYLLNDFLDTFLSRKK